MSACNSLCSRSTSADYDILFDRRLGKGGFGEVYFAVHLATNREVAIKLINKSIVKEENAFKRIWDEVRIHSMLKHPNIVEMLDCFQDENYIYIVLELCSNGDLRRYLKTIGRPLSETHAASVLEQVVDGVLFLHTKQIIHRDLSASNILLDKHGVVKIADFGLATQITQVNEKHFTMCGTPNYIAPEIAMRKPHGLEADLWSLGCLLYTLLSGHPPFGNNGQVSQTLKRIVTGAIDIPRNISNEATNLIRGLMQSDAERRLKLTTLRNHPFFKKHREKGGAYLSLASADSGRGTISTGIATGRTSRPVFSKPVGLSNSNLYAPHNYGIAPEHQMCFSSSSSERPPNGTHPRWRSCETRPKVPLPLPLPPLPRSVSDTHVGDTCRLNAAARSQCQHGCSHICTQCCSHASGDGLPVTHLSGNPYADMQQYSGGHQVMTSPCSSTSALRRGDPFADIVRDGAGRALRDILVPLSAKRLAPTQQRTKKVVLSITDENEVIIQVYSKLSSHGSFLRVSPDGRKIIVYQMNAESDGYACRQVYTFDSLPTKYWKTYQLAFNFVQLIRAKTPKVTLFGEEGKCHLMEDMTAKVYLSNAREAIKKCGSQAWVCMQGGQPDLLSSKEEVLCDQLQQRCLRIEKALREAEGKEENNFPAIVGRYKGKQRISAAGEEATIDRKMPNRIDNQPSASNSMAAASVYLKEYGCSVQKLKEAGVLNYDSGEKLRLMKSGDLEYVDHTGQLYRFSSRDVLPSKVKEKVAQIDTIFRAYAKRLKQL
uniref:Serine/threonine-protein kinase SAK n=1 Tax=Trichuris muris TaxID=70415 RepID=A0A5S6QTA1_TRIMR